MKRLQSLLKEPAVSVFRNMYQTIRCQNSVDRNLNISHVTEHLLMSQCRLKDRSFPIINAFFNQLKLKYGLSKHKKLSKCAVYITTYVCVLA
jgi:hypothetical protein